MEKKKEKVKKIIIFKIRHTCTWHNFKIAELCSMDYGKSGGEDEQMKNFH